MHGLEEAKIPKQQLQKYAHLSLSLLLLVVKFFRMIPGNILAVGAAPGRVKTISECPLVWSLSLIIYE